VNDTATTVLADALAFHGITMAVLAATGSLIGSRDMKSRLTAAQLKRFIGVLPWVIATKMIWDLIR